MKTKVSLVTGFLGSGKTALLRHYLSRPAGPPMERIGLLINEVGEGDFAPALLKRTRATLVELSQGCICCQAPNDLVVALKSLAGKGATRIFIESTGIADPGKILSLLRESPTLRGHFAVEPTVVVIDAAGFFSLFQTLAFYYVTQIRAADLVVLNKADVATRSQLKEAQREIRKLNPKALVVRAKRGVTDLFGMLEGRPWSGSRRAPRAGEVQVSDGAGTKPSGFQSLTLRTSGVLDAGTLRRFLEDLPESIYRAKGVVRFPGGFHTVSYTAGRYDEEPLAGPSGTSHLIFIGSRFEEKRIVSQIKKCLGGT